MDNIPKRYVCILALFSLLAFPMANTATASDLTAAEILFRMKEAYANARTYQDKGLVEVVIHFPDRTHKVKKPFTTAFIRPDRFRYEYSEVKSLVRISKFVAYLNGQKVKVYWELDEGASQIETIGEALAAAAGISGGSARTVPTMLLPDKSRFRNAILFFSSPKRADDEMIDGINCYRIEDPNDYRDLTMWVDKEQFLLRKIYVEKDLKDSRAETTTTYKPILNGEVTDKMLAFDSSK